MLAPLLPSPIRFQSLPLSPAHQHRLSWTLERLREQPQTGLPRALGEAGYKGLMRVLKEAQEEGVSLLGPVYETTCERLVPGETMLALEDTCDISFGGSRGRQSLPRLEGKSTGYRLHLTLLARPGQTPQVVGVVALESLTRADETKTAQTARQRHDDPAKESLRWPRAVEASEARVAGRASLIHVRDREADDYAPLCAMVAQNQRFIQRQRQARLLAQGPAHAPEARTTKEAWEGVTGECLREVVTLGPRAQWKNDTRSKEDKAKYPARPARQATLHYAAQTMVLRRPDHVSDSLPEQMTVNVVRVWEVDAPEGQSPVEWSLLTTEPVETHEQVLFVVDSYRARWLIEEFFKGLKTGCQYEKLQMESVERLVTMLAFYAPIVTQLLQLRTLAQARSEAPVSEVFDEAQVEALRGAHAFGCLRPPKHQPAPKTVQEALALVARLGGFLGKKGEAGWQVLLRGMVHLWERTEGLKQGRLLKGPEASENGSKPTVPS